MWFVLGRNCSKWKQLNLNVSQYIVFIINLFLLIFLLIFLACFQPRRMTDVLQLQDFLVTHGVIPIILDLLISKSGAIFREVLALLNCLLYDANGSVQNETIKYFKQNQDEMFFKMVLDYLKQASLLAKER